MALVQVRKGPLQKYEIHLWWTMITVENKNTIENCGETLKNINITYVHRV